MWALRQLGVFPREVQLMITRHLYANDAYCWRCLHRFSVHTFDILIRGYDDGQDDRKPLCGVTCAPRRSFPPRSRSYIPRGMQAEFEHGFTDTVIGRQEFINSLFGMYPPPPPPPSDQQLRAAWRFLCHLAKDTMPAEPDFGGRHANQQRVLKIIVADRVAAAPAIRHVHRKGKRK